MGRRERKGWSIIIKYYYYVGRQKKEYSDLVVVRSTTPKRFVGTMNS